MRSLAAFEKASKVTIEKIGKNLYAQVKDFKIGKDFHYMPDNSEWTHHDNGIKVKIAPIKTMVEDQISEGATSYHQSTTGVGGGNLATYPGRASVVPWGSRESSRTTTPLITTKFMIMR